MIYPKRLKENDIIEIISPSNGVKSKKIEKFEKAVKKLNSYGFKVIEDKYVRNSENGVSSSAFNRSIELNNTIKNTDVKALIACSGGDYLVQIMDLINFNDIKENPKWIQGQSDITPLLFYITTKFDIATIYSFNAKSFGDDDLPESMIKNNIEFLKGSMPKQIEYGYKIGDDKILQTWECITEDKEFKGRIIGGCLDSLKDIIGTKYDCVKKFIKKYSKDGIIWYFDVAGMTNEDILRTMWQFKNAGWFIGCKGILYGRIENEINYTGTTLRDAVNNNFCDLNIPIFINTDIGHTEPVHTLINGSLVKITKDKDNKHIVETMFE
jgi:muramoyltetrapeptide carboxypeptidase LdcA involved in peptidoglycan recycling